MDSEHARDLFSEALEGDLEDERKDAFDAALEEDEELKAEYEEFVETFDLLHHLASEETVRPPNLLPRIQERIRRRSGGRYYRDRFARRTGGPGWTMPVIAAVCVLVLLGVVYYALETTVLLDDAARPAGGAPSEEPADVPSDDGPAEPADVPSDDGPAEP